MTQPKFSDLRNFCEHDKWDRKRKSDHWRYTKRLADGRTLRTTVSFGSGELGDPDLLAVILREQLHVSEAEFRRVVNGRGLAVRSTLPPAASVTAVILSATTVLQLRKRGVTDEQVRVLKGQADAEALLERLTCHP